MNAKLVPLLTFCATFFVATAAFAEKPTVATVNYPLAFFAETIGGDEIEVLFPQIDGDPAYWKPTDKQIASFQQANLILRNGATYAKWAKRVSLPKSTQVDTSESFRELYLKDDKAVVHTHRDGTSHSHAGTAFTTWIDLELARKQASSVHEAIQNLLPDEKHAELDKRHQMLEEQLTSLHQQFLEIGKSIDHRHLVASHPVYQYFARAYGLKIESVHWEPDTVPGKKEVAELDRLLKKNQSSVMIWEATPLEQSIELLKQKGIKSIVVNPCGNRPTEGDFLSVIAANIDSLRSLVKQ